MELAELQSETERIIIANKTNESRAAHNAQMFSKKGMQGAISNFDAETFRVTHKLNLLADEGAYMLIVDS